jgi:hypothetical protein
MLHAQVWHSLEYTTEVVNFATGVPENNTTGYKEMMRAGGRGAWNYEKKLLGVLFSCFALLLYRICILVSNYVLFHPNCFVSLDITFML